MARFYWLKLKQDFFQSREMKKLRLIAGGATYTIIYLKMQLLSINKEGYLEFEKTESDISEQIALEIDEQIEDVRLTIAFLKANNLIEMSEEDGLFMPNVIKSTGSETDSAERMRRFRNKEDSNRLTDGRHNVTDMCDDVTQRKEKENKREDKEKDTEIHKQIISSLNQISGRNFRLTESTKKFINGRLKEGFTLADFESVIKYKTKEWSNTEMAQYIRPQTLFGTKFESYLESIPKPKIVEEPKDKPATEADRELISNILAKVGNKVWKNFGEN